MGPGDVLFAVFTLFIIIALVASTLSRIGGRDPRLPHKVYPTVEHKTNKRQIDNMDEQRRRSAQALAELRLKGVGLDAKVELQYVFHSDKESNAKLLRSSLLERGYRVEVQRRVDGDNQFDVKGWTTLVLMTETELIGWTGQMCRMGIDFDCVFAGWGVDGKKP